MPRRLTSISTLNSAMPIKSGCSWVNSPIKFSFVVFSEDSEQPTLRNESLRHEYSHRYLLI